VDGPTTHRTKNEPGFRQQRLRHLARWTRAPEPRQRICWVLHDFTRGGDGRSIMTTAGRASVRDKLRIGLIAAALRARPPDACSVRTMLACSRTASVEQQTGRAVARPSQRLVDHTVQEQIGAGGLRQRVLAANCQEDAGLPDRGASTRHRGCPHMEPAVTGNGLHGGRWSTGAARQRRWQPPPHGPRSVGERWVHQLAGRCADRGIDYQAGHAPKPPTRDATIRGDRVGRPPRERRDHLEACEVASDASRLAPRSRPGSTRAPRRSTNDRIDR